MNKIKLWLTILFTALSLTSNAAYAAEKKEVKAADTVVIASEDKESIKKYQQTIDEYKKYLQTIPADLKEEVKNYRKEIIQINNKKRDAYKKLSNKGQEFLKKEREFKKKLPFRMRKQLHEVADADQATNNDNVKDTKK